METLSRATKLKGMLQVQNQRPPPPSPEVSDQKPHLASQNSSTERTVSKEIVNSLKETVESISKECSRFFQCPLWLSDFISISCLKNEKQKKEGRLRDIG